MKKLKKIVKYCYLKTLKGGKCPIFTAIEAEYKNEFKIPHYGFQYTHKMNEVVGMMIADLYESINAKPNDIFVRAAYEQLAKEVIWQFEFLQNSDMKIYFEPYEGEGEPYKNSFEMLNDLHNYHMYFFKTECGFGEEECDEKDNIMLNKTGIVINGYELLINDVFRIIHDIFGHAAYGYSFGPIGEDYAWITHSQMFTPLARAAITTETRGQNCWVNYGPHMRKSNSELYNKNEEGWLHPVERPFAKQKMILLPEAVSGIRLLEQNNIVYGTLLKHWNPFLNLIHTHGYRKASRRSIFTNDIYSLY